MQFIKSISLSHLFDSVQASARRFPLPFVFTLTAALSLHLHFMLEQELYLRGFIFSSLVFILSLTLYLEKEKNKLSLRVFSFFLVLVLSGSAYSAFFEYEALNSIFDMRMSILFIVAFLLLASAPIIRLNDEQKFYFYLNNLGMLFLISFAYALVLQILGVIALVTIEQLFSLEVDKGYGYLSIWIFLFFLPLSFLSRLPEDIDTIYCSMHERLVKYVLLPAMLIYFLIIVAYLAKIVYLSSWPQGTLSFLILWFISLGFTVLFFLVPQANTSWPAVIRKLFLYLLMPLSVVLFLAWYQRVEAYGLTVLRYYLIVVIVWIVLSGLYLLFSKTKHLQNSIPFLAALGFLSLYGPFNAISVSNSSQLDKFLAYVKENKMMEKGCIDKTLSSLTYDENLQMSSILLYLEKYNGLKALEKSFCQVPEEMSAYAYAEDMGFKLIYNGGDKEKYFYLSRYEEHLDFPAKGRWIPFSFYELRDDRVKPYLYIKDNVILYELKDVKISFELKEYFNEIVKIGTLNNSNSVVKGSKENSYIMFDSIMGDGIDADLNVSSYTGHVFIPE